MDRDFQGLRNCRDFVIQNRSDTTFNFGNLRLIQLDSVAREAANHVVLDDLGICSQPDSEDGSSRDVPFVGFFWHSAVEGAAIVDLFVARIILWGNKNGGSGGSEPLIPMKANSPKLLTVFVSVLVMMAVVALRERLVSARSSVGAPGQRAELDRIQHTIWTGGCQNATYGDDGRLKIYLVENGAKLTGYVSISGNLVGSGEIVGTRSGSAYSFTSVDPAINVPIAWQGRRDGARLVGEYAIEALPSLGTIKQVGEWQVALAMVAKDGVPDSDAGFRSLFMLMLEIDLNRPVQRKDGSMVTGAQALFEQVHPAGVGVSVNVSNVEVEWIEGSAKREMKDIRKYAVDYTIFWTGLFQKKGTTQMRLRYNAAIGAVTSQEIVGTTGVTNRDLNEVGFAIGVLIGKAAMDAFLNRN